ncbi:hypothetical protein F7725_004243 [Dissostichus mawsoni]|uniref:Calponin-homology (CH) domain-containing protein n=1 Tax=Dissostichus mawsoni TaxID=36200 RepID=A0A7J5XJK5_DISMA|nr:hypothetical protein F7725_004243 [Dissostichus mawsoni]
MKQSKRGGLMAAGDGAQLPATVAASRSVEKALEEAAASGALNLSNRKLKEFPRSARNYDLSDITHADLSKNRLCELPEELCQFISVETLSLYHNGMRSLSSSLGNLQALTYLNLSRNLLSSLPPSVFQLPLLRVLIDVSCNELQGLPAELGQLESLRDLNLRRNQLTTLPEAPSGPARCVLQPHSHVPLCYRHLRHLQTVLLDNNPLQMPPAQICSKGKYHIFKYLNMEACKRNQEELERHLRPTGFNSCLSEQELFTGQFGGLDSGFNSVDSGSKRWSGNESADDFSERSLRLAEVSRDQRNLEEEEEEEEEHRSPLEANKVNGDAGHVDFIDSSVTEEEEMRMHPPTPPLTAPPLVQPPCGRGPPILDLPLPLSPSSPSLEERRRPGTLFIWQERERLQQQQRDKASGGSPENSSSLSGLRQRCAVSTDLSSSYTEQELHRSLMKAHRVPFPQSADQMSAAPPPTLLQRSSSRSDVPSSPKTSSPPGQTQRPNSFLFRASSRTNSGRSESRTMLRSPKEERADITQLRKTLESRLKVSLPEDLGEALTNGTVLCQLVNQIRVRSVSIIHIPSPAVPKLSSAKCRLNVENFLSACRKLGVSEDSLCSPQLITEDEGLSRLAQTVQSLVDLADSSQRGPRTQT